MTFFQILWTEGCTYDKFGRNRTLCGQTRPRNKWRMWKCHSSVAVTVTVFSGNDCGNRNSGVCEGQASAQEAPQTVKRQSRGNLFGAFVSCVPFFSVSVGVLTSVSSYTACCEYVQSVTVAPSNSFDTHSGVSTRVLQPDIRGSVGVEPKLERVRCASLRSFRGLC